MRRSPAIWLVTAVTCSVLLMVVTVSARVVPGDWARVDSIGRSLPQQIDQAWPGYGWQLALMAGIGVGLWRAARSTDLGHHGRGIRQRGAGRVTFLLVAITLIGFGLRLRTLAALPLIIDEIGFAARASDILHGQRVPILAPGHNGNPSAFSWLVAGSMAMFGQHAWAARLVTLAFGTLSIPAVYRLGRAWWSSRAGLLAAIFLATFPAHIHFSRMALYNLVDPFFGLLALTLLARGLRRRQNRLMALAGLLAGVSTWFYHGSLMTAALMVVYLVLEGGRGWRRSAGWLAVGFLVAALPRYAPTLLNGLPLTGNLQGARLPEDAMANGLRASLAWVGQPDVSPFWLSERPLLEPGALIALGLGLMLCWRWRRAGRGALALLIVPLATLFGGALWPAAPLYVRYMTAAPIMAVTAGAGLAWLQQKMRGRRVLVTLGLFVYLYGGGVLGAWRQPAEALSRISAGQWEEAGLAQQAADLPPGEGAALLVTAEFGTVQRVTVADAVAAAGMRRPVLVLAGTTDEEGTTFRLDGVVYRALRWGEQKTLTGAG